MKKLTDSLITQELGTGPATSGIGIGDLGLPSRPSARVAGVTLRALELHDRDALRAMFERLSPDSRYRRFLTTAASFDIALRNVLDLDYVQRDAIVAVAGDQIIGVAESRAFRREPSDVEVAVTIDDSYHRRGLGREMLDLVIGRARRHGARTVHASVLAENRPMIELLAKLAPGAHKELDRGVVDFAFSLPASA
jgi:RimJ/RimL family protein N-acetyltransferase